jgi:DNA-binding PadR family transcriptional regulator
LTCGTIPIIGLVESHRECNLSLAGLICSKRKSPCVHLSSIVFIFNLCLCSLAKRGDAGIGHSTGKLIRGLLEPFVLDSIAREPKHGYALIQELEQAFGAPPNRNQVYPLLNRLQKDGFLQADRSEGRGRTRYALTGKGLELLKEYRLRTGLFRERVAGLWGLEPSSPTGAPSAQPALATPPGPHLLDRLALPGEAPAPLAPGSKQHAGRSCEAEVALRRQPGRDRVAIEMANLDPACPTCQDLGRLLQGVRDRWFASF